MSAGAKSLARNRIERIQKNWRQKEIFDNCKASLNMQKQQVGTFSRHTTRKVVFKNCNRKMKLSGTFKTVRQWM